MDNVSTIGSDDFLQIVYVNGSDEITYRTAKDGGDISGDYNVYKNKKDIKIGSYDAQIRGNDGVCSVIWTDGEFSFSLYSSKEFSEKEMLDVISDILK